MISVFIRIEFEDGFFLTVEKEVFDYNNDFDSYISKHGSITHLDMVIES